MCTQIDIYVFIRRFSRTVSSDMKAKERTAVLEREAVTAKAQLDKVMLDLASEQQERELVPCSLSHVIL